MDAIGQAAVVRWRQATRVELVKVAVARIQRLNLDRRPRRGFTMV